MAVSWAREHWPKAASIVLAFVLWLNVADESVVERGLQVPLEFENMPRGLEVASELPDHVSLRVRGSTSAVSRLDPQSVAVRLDLAEAGPGRHLFDLFAARIAVPPGVEVTGVVPGSVAVTLEPAGVAREVPITPEIAGRPDARFTVDSITAVPASVRVVGPDRRLARLREAITAPVSVEGAREDVVVEVNVGVTDPTLHLATPVVALVRVRIVPAKVEQTVDVPLEVVGWTSGGRPTLARPLVAVVVQGDGEIPDGSPVVGLRAYVDVGALAGRPAGHYDLPVTVDPRDGLHVVGVDPKTVSVRLD